jgi:hypothetical protein
MHYMACSVSIWITQAVGGVKKVKLPLTGVAACACRDAYALLPSLHIHALFKSNKYCEAGARCMDHMSYRSSLKTTIILLRVTYHGTG